MVLLLLLGLHLQPLSYESCGVCWGLQCRARVVGTDRLTSMPDWSLHTSHDVPGATCQHHASPSQKPWPHPTNPTHRQQTTTLL